MQQSIENNQTNNIKNILSTLAPLSFYSPVIILSGLLIFSVFSSGYGKLNMYYLWIFIVTMLRVGFLLLKQYMDNKNGAKPKIPLPAICNTGVTSIFIPEDATYSTYILAFTMSYLLTPLVMLTTQSGVNAMNYFALAFFIIYILFDLMIKYSFSCVRSLISVVLGDLVSGITLGIGASILMYSYLRNFLYINEINSDKEVCSMPSKQQFKCSVYKNGELVSSSIN
jgi:hypothetical protein